MKEAIIYSKQVGNSIEIFERGTWQRSFGQSGRGGARPLNASKHYMIWRENGVPSGEVLIGFNPRVVKMGVDWYYEYDKIYKTDFETLKIHKSQKFINQVLNGLNDQYVK
jgi:hypothetical protein